MKAFLILIISLFAYISYANEGKTKLQIEAHGFLSDEGSARILIFKEEQKESFPSKHKNAFYKKIVKIKNKHVKIDIDDIPFGAYAISIHHDKNNDGKVNTNFLKIPNEGLGCSNDAKGNFGPPPFDKAKIILNKESHKITINMVN